ncbi:MAG: hypothetical protein P1P64_05705 [Treponemataceae bacterium]
MKKSLGLIFCFLLAFTSYAQRQKTQTMYVSVKDLKVKSGTVFFASTLTKLEYGDRVLVIEEKGKHSKIRTEKNVEGWVPSSSLTKKKVIKNSNVSASQDEIALAGKGFTAEIENEYKKNAKYNYSAVDEVELKSVSETELKAFMKKRNMLE